MFTQEKTRDSTALARQNRRLRKLKQGGVVRSTLFVHESCKSALDDLRPHFVDPKKAEELANLAQQLLEDRKPTNVAQVEQLSPFRYPGGKTWLIPQIRSWLKASGRVPDVLVEPFAGGAMAGLTAAAEALTYSVVLSEIDEDVAAVWKTIFDGTEADVEWLCEQITGFDVDLGNVQRVLHGEPKGTVARAFRTIIKNRMQRGGIMAAGAGLVKAGESGKGLKSRWYPATLAERIRRLRLLRNQITFLHGDAFCTIEQFVDSPNAFFFIDPPYTAGGKKAGKRLYSHSEVDHSALFELVSTIRGSAMLTYDDAPEVHELARRFDFRIETVPMKSTHHAILQELLIFKS